MTPRQTTLARLVELGITPDTRLGQHFLVDDNIVRVAVRLADLRDRDVVLEVGPGVGVLTHALADACSHVHAVEIDRRLEPALLATLGERTNVDVVYGDALAIDLAALAPPATAFVANLPYNVATPLVVESLGRLPLVERWAVMVQREVADRFFAQPATPAYGGVSVLIQLACERTGFHRVSRSVFAPPPNVDSAIVAFRRRPGSDLEHAWPEIVRLVHGAFAHRRKTLANSIVLAEIATREVAEVAIAAIGLGPRVRAEELQPPQFPVLAAELRRARG